VKIRRIDLHDDALLHQYYVTMRAADLYERERMPYWSEHAAAVMFRREEPGEQWHFFAAFDGEGDDEHIVGTAYMVLPLSDNLQFAFLGVAVAPENRCRGIGSALAEYVVAEARKTGRTRLTGEMNIPFEEREAHPYRRFAERHGFSLANVEISRILELPVSDDQLAEWIDESAPHHPGYRIETFVDEIPKELVPSLVHVRNQLAADAPTGDLDFEAEKMTPEEFEIRREKAKEMGRTIFETVAIDDSDGTGKVVAHSTLAVPNDDPGNVYQWGTLVLREHRGHRLGMAVKARNLRAVQQAYPDRKRVITSNAEVNAPMVSINERMGFKPVELMAEFQRTYDEPA
jgi:GNAT superfamily N-acetyltransferase